MSTRPTPPYAGSSTDGSGASPFPGLGAGLDFFQQWMKAASSAMPGMGSAATQGATAWAMPTLDPEELDKRIQELKTVQFWLEQNARMLGMTIQTLEVQRMTLQTLKGMKVPMDALRESLRAQPPFAAASPSPASPTAAAPAAGEPPATPQPAPAAGASEALSVNPMQWWSTLTEQFSTLASQAVQASQDAMNAAGSSAPAQGADQGEPPPAGSETQAAPERPSASAARPRTATQTVPKPAAGKPRR